MNLEERIVLLLQSLEEESVMLGATLLNNIGDFEHEVEIFQKACNSEADPVKGSLLVTDTRIKGNFNHTAISAWIGIRGKNWILWFYPHSWLYMLDNVISKAWIAQRNRAKIIQL